MAEAERYDDDMQRRGVLSACFELGELDTLGERVREHTSFRDRDDFLDEMRTLRGQLTGTIPTDRLWEGQALGKPQRPQEMANLPALRAQLDAAQREQLGAAYRIQAARPR